MIGLPVAGRDAAGQKAEEEEIVEFILEVAARSGMHFNINVGAFVPTPHTPYQWVSQLDEQTAWEKIRHIRNSLKPRGHKVSYNDPFIAVLEGLLSRGDGRVGELVEEAYERGCRFDAWDEHINKALWAELLERCGPLVRETSGERDPEKPLPWDCIGSGVSAAFLRREYDKSRHAEFTAPCAENCDKPCGACAGETKIVFNSTHDNNLLQEKPISGEAKTENNIIHNDNLLQVKTLKQNPEKRDPHTLRVVFSFAKQRSAAFLPHLALIEIFSMAFVRSRIPVLFTQGFNPTPRLDFAFPLSLGLQAWGEIAGVDLELPGGADCAAEDFVRTINSSLPEGIRAQEAIKVLIPSGAKKRSLPSLLWGSVYQAEDGTEDMVPAGEEKSYRIARTSSGRSLYRLNRKAVLARSPEDPQTPNSYFAVYRELYP
jgi:hypothetical protein